MEDSPETMIPAGFCSPRKHADAPPAKKRKSDHTTTELQAKVQEVRTELKLPTRATKRRRPSASDDASSTEEETFEPAAKRPRYSTLDVEIRPIGQMFYGTNAYLLGKTLPLFHKPIPLLSTRQYGKQSIQPASDNFLAPRPPIREHSVPESTTLEGIKMGRPFCTAEEDVQRGEKVKYQQLVEMAKEKYSRSRPTPQLTSFHNVQAYSKEPAMTYLGEPKRGGDVYPWTTPRTGIKCIDVCCPESSQRDNMMRYFPPAEQSQERPVKQAVAGKKNGAEISEDVSFQARLAPGQVKKLAAFGVEKKKLPSLERTVEHFAPLTEAMEREVSAAFGKGEPAEIMSSAFKLKVTREDIQTLRNLYWLNDEVINFYLRLVMERSKKEGYPAVHAFSTFFYSKLSAGGFRAVRRWTRNLDLFKQDIILVPIHLRLHWTLAVIDFRAKTVKHYDSMGQKGDTICQILLKYLQEESREKRNMELNISEWTIHSMEPYEIPQQLNGSDCGVFTCKYADYVARDKPMNFTQTHMPYFRRRMVWEIIHQQLL